MFKDSADNGRTDCDIIAKCIAHVGYIFYHERESDTFRLSDHFIAIFYLETFVTIYIYTYMHARTCNETLILVHYRYNFRAARI